MERQKCQASTWAQHIHGTPGLLDGGPWFEMEPDPDDVSTVLAKSRRGVGSVPFGEEVTSRR